MNLFTRVNSINPDKAPEAVAFSLEIAEYVSNSTGLELRTWTALYGAPIGTISWSSRVDSQAAMGAVGDQLEADPKYQEMLQSARGLFTGLPQDQIGEIVATAGSAGIDPQFATIVTAQCAAGKIADAMGWGVDVLNHVHGLTGLDSFLVRGIYGPWATLAWITVASSLDEVDAAGAAMGTDPSYIERLDSGGDLFTPGSAESRLIRRIG